MKISFSMFMSLVFSLLWHAVLGDTSGLEAAGMNLGADSFAERETASRFLWSQGRRAKEVLERASASEDPEVRVRAREILRKVKFGVFEDTPVDMAGRLSGFENLDDIGRHSLLEDLAALGETGWRSLLMLVETHISDSDLSLEPLSELAGNREFLLELLSKSPDWDVLIEHLLIVRALARHGDYRGLMSWLMLHGSLDERIADFEGGMKGPRGGAYRRCLAKLYRAAGRLDDARKAAEETGQDFLAFRVAMEGKDYHGALRVLDGSRLGDSDEDIFGWQLTLQRLAGKSEEMEKSLAGLLDVVRGDRYQMWPAAKVLLINEMIPQAVFLLKESSSGASYVSAFDRRLEDYIDLNEFFLEKNGEAELSYIVFLHRSGEKSRAQGLLADIVAKGWSGTTPGRIAEMIKTAREISCECYEKLLSDVCAKPGTDFDKLADGVFGSAGFWRDYFKLKHPGDDELEIFKRLSGLAGSVIVKDRLLEMLAELDSMIDRANPEKRLEMRRIMRDLYGRAGDDNGYLSQLNKLLELDDSIAPMLDLGDWYAARGEWDTAAEWFKKAAECEPGEALPLFLLGNAIGESGDLHEGERKMRLAGLMPFGSPQHRHALASGLIRRGMLAAARVNYDILRCGQTFNSWFLQQSYYRIHDIDRRLKTAGGDLAGSSQYLLLGNMECLAPNISYTYNGGYLFLAYEHHLLHAKDLLELGNSARAFEEYQRAFNLIHEDVDQVIDAVIELDKKGLPDRAGEMYSLQKSRMLKEIELLPASGNIKNSLAWLMSRTGRDLDLALDLSKQTVGSNPQNAAFLDTLAEVYFRLRNRDEAVAWQRKAVMHASEGDREFMEERLDSFQNDPFHK
ncbi:MAG: tetratricopeptide repeat protein [Victivallales bacterium]|nr:tetratricopeptide repeat protein [Victivallales bacterium]